METGGETLEAIGALKQSVDRSVVQKYRAEQFQKLLRPRKSKLPATARTTSLRLVHVVARLAIDRLLVLRDGTGLAFLQ